MKHPDETLVTPLYVKTDPLMEWPEDERAFYLLSSSGLFLCRNHPFFRSCVPARTWPSELAPQDVSLRFQYPKLSQRQIELIVGFFATIGERYGAEAAVLLVWDRRSRRMKFHVPEQRATVSVSLTGRSWPVSLHYETPRTLSRDLSIIGDVHSHVDSPAYASSTDQEDEKHRAGVHLVVGKIYREPPDFHCEVVVDGFRFEIDPGAVFDDYARRSPTVRQEWIDRVSIDTLEPTTWEVSSDGTYVYRGASTGGRDSMLDSALPAIGHDDPARARDTAGDRNDGDGCIGSAEDGDETP